MLAVLLALATGGDTVALKASLAVALKDSLAVAHYWQQQVAYVISAALDEPSGVLTGQVRIAYVNRSPDTLHDFFVHQYLNAFRPGSRWAAADDAEGRDRFQRLADPDYAFERITAATLMGQSLKPDYPYASDSTIAHWTLPRGLAPGESMIVEIAWQARPSTLPRRQGRAGRRFDFAQWYPKVVVYDPYGWEDHALYPAGAFYGEFATFDVTLDVAEDQVIGATGVAVEGDPGWERVRADAAQRVDYQRGYYGQRATSTCPALRLAAGRKCVHFFAENVHHFAFSLNPQFVYGEGRWREAYLDEGLTSFQTAWFFERHGDSTSFRASEATVLQLDLDRWSEPVATVSERFRDFFTYNRMVYTRGLLFYRQLRYVVGEETMRRMLRAYYDRWKLKHVDEDAFRQVAEDVSGQDLKWLFGQWLHATPLIDYRLKRVERRALPDGRWRTTVTIERKGDGWMPVEIGTRKGDTIYARAAGQAEIERVEFITARKPGRLMLDPRLQAFDYNMLNNEEQGLRWLLTGSRTHETRVDDPFAETARRDRQVVALFPVVWSNDYGGRTLAR